MPSSKPSEKETNRRGWVRPRPKESKHKKAQDKDTAQASEAESAYTASIRRSGRSSKGGYQHADATSRRKSSPPSATAAYSVSSGADGSSGSPGRELAVFRASNPFMEYKSHGLSRNELAVRAMIRGGRRLPQSDARSLASRPPPLGSMESFNTEEYPPHCYRPITSRGIDPDTGMREYRVSLVVYTSPWEGEVTRITNTWKQHPNEVPSIDKALFSGGPPSRRTDEELNYWKDKWLEQARSEQLKLWGNNTRMLQSDEELLKSHLATERAKFYSPDGWTRHAMQPSGGTQRQISYDGDEWEKQIGRLQITGNKSESESEEGSFSSDESR